MHPHPHTRAKFTSCMLQRRRSRCRPTAATLSRFSTRHPPPATLLSHSSVSTTPSPLNPPSKQPSIITKAPALYVRIAPIHPPSKGLISALPLELVLLPPPCGSAATPSRLTREPRISMRPILYRFALNSRLFVLSQSFFAFKLRDIPWSPRNPCRLAYWRGNR